MGAINDASPPGDADNRLAWPNAQSQTSSDPWLVDNHDSIEVMRPRILALNFVNRRSNDEMLSFFGDIIAAIREGTRPHGYENPGAKPFLEYEVAYAIDLRDSTPPANWALNNSTLYPREEPQEGAYGLDYEQLFSQAFADRYKIEDLDQPGTYLTLCELSERGLVHEVWIYADGDVPDVGGAEILGIKPRYDTNFDRIPGEMDRCAGNGCFDADDVIPAACKNTLRIGWVNNSRGVGCYLESLSHGLETIANDNYVPYLTSYWKEFAGFDLDTRYGAPFNSWYGLCQGTGNCLSYPTTSSVAYNAGSVGMISPYVPVCGNAHFPPNANDHYDVNSSTTVLSSCEGYRSAGGPGNGDPEKPINANSWSQYNSIASDCMGGWGVYWWQNFPGLGTAARDNSGTTMKNWWPFLFY